jgi:hypothetical protein
MTNEQLAIALTRLEGKLDNIVTDVAEIRVQTTMTNGRVTALETKDTSRIAAEAVRAEIASVTKRELDRAQSRRFGWVAAIGTCGGLVIGATTAAAAILAG